MRTISPTANRLLTVLMAVAVWWSTRLAWFAPTASDPKGTDGPVEQAAWQLARVFQDVAGTRTGEDGLLVAAAALAAALAVVLLVAPAAWLGDVLRLIGFAPALLVLASAVSAPRGTGVHYGVLVAGAASLLLAGAAWQGGVVRARGTTAVRY